MENNTQTKSYCWTEAETELLVKMKEAGASYNEISLVIGRTKQALQSRYSKTVTGNSYAKKAEKKAVIAEPRIQMVPDYQREIIVLERGCVL